MGKTEKKKVYKKVLPLPFFDKILMVANNVAYSKVPLSTDRPFSSK
jgi:hypothetical protein